MTGPAGEPDAPLPEPAPPPPPVVPGPPSATDGRRDRLLLAALWVYAALLAVAAVGQISGNRFLLDLFDLRRLFNA